MYLKIQAQGQKMCCKLETAEYFTTCIAIFHLWNDLNLHVLFPLFFGPADARTDPRILPVPSRNPDDLGPLVEVGLEARRYR